MMWPDLVAGTGVAPVERTSAAGPERGEGFAQNQPIPRAVSHWDAATMPSRSPTVRTYNSHEANLTPCRLCAPYKICPGDRIEVEVVQPDGAAP
jgi:hypothetical protein